MPPQRSLRPGIRYSTTNRPSSFSFLFSFFEPILPFLPFSLPYRKSCRTPMIFHLVIWVEFEDHVFLQRNRLSVNVRRTVTPLPHSAHRHRYQRSRSTEWLHVRNRSIRSDRRAQVDRAALHFSRAPRTQP